MNLCLDINKFFLVTSEPYFCDSNHSERAGVISPPKMIDVLF